MQHEQQVLALNGHNGAPHLSLLCLDQPNELLDLIKVGLSQQLRQHLLVVGQVHGTISQQVQDVPKVCGIAVWRECAHPWWQQRECALYCARGWRQ